MFIDVADLGGCAFADAMQAALKERGLDKMIEDARAENRENDLENMKPSRCMWAISPKDSTITNETQSETNRTCAV